MGAGRVLTGGKRVYVAFLVTKAIEELAPAIMPQDVGVNIAGERITVGILWPGTRTGRLSVGENQVLLN